MNREAESIKTETDTGGFAFARAAGPSGSDWCNGDPGMTLRDYFAAHALTALAISGIITRDSDVTMDAEIAFQLADACLKARQS